MSHLPPFTQRLATAACALLTGSLVWATDGLPARPEAPAVHAPADAGASPPVPADAGASPSVPADAGASPPVPADPGASPSVPADADGAFEPRIIRGNDQVIRAPRPVPLADGAPSSFRFEEAPIAEVVRTMLGDILKADYVLHPPISGSITLATRAPVAPDQAIFLLETALQANGLLLLRDPRGTYHVGRPEALKGIGAAVRQIDGAGPLPPGSGAVVVPLQFIGAAEMAAILRPMIPNEALVRVDMLRNLLVLAGSRTQAEGWLDIIGTFDIDLLKGMSVGVFPLKYASVKEIEAALQWMSTGNPTRQSRPPGTTVVPGAVGGGAGTAGPAAGLADNLPLAGAVRVLPIERINSILVVTPRASSLDEARRWIERLDQPSGNNAEPQLFIYQVQNVNARHLANVLSGIFGSTQPTAANSTNSTGSGVAPGLDTATVVAGPVFGSPSPDGGLWLGNSSNISNGATGIGLRQGRFPSGANGSSTVGSGGRNTTATPAPVVASLGQVRVMADELNNAVLVWSTRAEYAKIESTLRRLDLPPTQVLIEASIIEVTLNDDLRYGLQWAFNDSHGSRLRGQGTLSSRDGNASGGILGDAMTGFSYALKSPAGAVRAMLNALSTKTTVKVVASPSLMVLDNHTAAIAVGDQTPIQAGTTRNLEGTVTNTNIQYKDTGVNLVVTPSVNAGNIVTMQVDQSVTDVGAKDEVTNQRAFLQRQLSSKVSVRSGESIVMGGLIQENSTATKSGIPVLHALPVIGGLFGTTVNDGKRTELLVVITPRVVRSDIDIRQVSEDLRDRMKGFVNLLPPADAAAPRPASQD